MDPFNKVVLFPKKRNHFCVHCFICLFVSNIFNGSLSKYFFLDCFHHQKPGRTQGNEVCQPLENSCKCRPEQRGNSPGEFCRKREGSAPKFEFQMAQKCRSGWLVISKLPR